MVGRMIQMYFSIFVRGLLWVVVFSIGFIQLLCVVLNLPVFFLIDGFCYNFCFCYVFVVISLLYLDNRKMFWCLGFLFCY